MKPSGSKVELPTARLRATRSSERARVASVQAAGWAQRQARAVSRVGRFVLELAVPTAIVMLLIWVSAQLAPKRHTHTHIDQELERLRRIQADIDRNMRTLEALRKLQPTWSAPVAQPQSPTIAPPPVTLPESYSSPAPPAQ